MNGTPPPPSDESGRAEEMVCRARAVVESHSQFVGRSQIFEFRFEKGVLVVRGSLPTYYLKQILQTTLKNVDGVRLIDNQVTVDISEGISGPIGSRCLC